MDRRRLLAVVSLAQLATGVVGMTLGIRRSYPYDFLMLHGRSDRIARDSVLMGTAMSAPVVMLVAQGVAVGVLVQRPSTSAQRVLGALGASMVVGYLGESLIRRRLRVSDWDRVESPLAAAAIALSAAMAIGGLRSRS